MKRLCRLTLGGPRRTIRHGSFCRGGNKMTVAPIHHICLDDRGVAYVAGTTLKVADIAIDAYTWGLSPREIQANHPRLFLAQIHAALAYYHDNQSEIDSQIAAWNAEYERLRDASPNPLTRAELEARLARRQDSSD